MPDKPKNKNAYIFAEAPPQMFSGKDPAVLRDNWWKWAMNKYNKVIINVNEDYAQFRPNIPDSTRERISSEIFNSPQFVELQEIFNKPVTQRDSTFIKNAQEIEKFNKLTNYYDTVKTIPLYSSREFDDEYNKLDSLYKTKPEDDIYFLGHNADKFFGVSTGELGYRLKNASYNNCYLGTCSGANRIMTDFPDIRNIYGYTGEGWFGPYSKGKTPEQMMYSLKKIESLMPTMVPKVVVGNPQYKVFNKVSSKKEGGKINWLKKYQFGGKTIPEIVIYGDKDKAKALDFQSRKYAENMAKYKKDSANYIRAKELYKDSLDANKFTNYLLGTNKKITALTEAFWNTPEAKEYQKLANKELEAEKKYGFTSDERSKLGDITFKYYLENIAKANDKLVKEINELQSKTDKYSVHGMPPGINRVEYNKVYRGPIVDNYNVLINPTKLVPTEYILNFANNDGWNFFPYFKKPIEPTEPVRPDTIPIRVIPEVHKKRPPTIPNQFKGLQQYEPWMEKYRVEKKQKGSKIDAVTGPAKSYPSSVSDLRLNLENKRRMPLVPSDPYFFSTVNVHDNLLNSVQKEIKNWLVARKATGRFDDQLGETNLDAQILNLGSVKNIDRPDFYTMLTNKIFGDKSNLDKFSKRDSMIIASSNAGGEYARSIHALHVDPGQLSTLRHENTHALGAMYQKDKIHDIIQWSHPYLDDPSEIYSRLMEYRLANKIDPNKVFAPEDIKIFRKQKDEFNLHRYTDKELLRLFNEVAENKQETNSVPMAQNGAVLKADKGVKTRKDFWRNQLAVNPKTGEKVPLQDPSLSFGEAIKNIINVKKAFSLGNSNTIKNDKQMLQAMETIDKLIPWVSKVPILRDVVKEKAADMMSRSKYADISGEEVPTILQQGQNNFTGVNMEGTTPNLINGYMLGDVTGLTPAPDSLKRIKYYERYGKDTPYYMLDSYTKANEPIDLKEILPYLSNSYDQTTIKNNIKNKVPMEFHPLNESYSPVHPSFNLAGHGVLIDWGEKGNPRLTTQDVWKFEPKEYQKRWENYKESKVLPGEYYSNDTAKRIIYLQAKAINDLGKIPYKGKRTGNIGFVQQNPITGIPTNDSLDYYFDNLKIGTEGWILPKENQNNK